MRRSPSCILVDRSRYLLTDRYVDCSTLKRALESFYATILAKGTYPFVYLSLDIDPTKVDVNVHPTKKEVGFEDEDEIVELICNKLGETLEKQGGARSFKVQVRPSLLSYSLDSAHPNSLSQTLLPSANTPKPSKSQAASASTDTPPEHKKASSSSWKAKTAPNKLVRTDAQSQTLDALFPSLGSTSKSSSAGTSKHRSTAADSASEAEEDGGSSRPTKRKKHQSDHDPDFARKLQAEQAAQARSARVRIAQSECALTSVRQLRKEVVEGRHEGAAASFLAKLSPSSLQALRRRMTRRCSPAYSILFRQDSTKSSRTTFSSESPTSNQDGRCSSTRPSSTSSTTAHSRASPVPSPPDPV